VLNPIKIFEGSFGGPTLYENPFYISPNKVCTYLFITRKQEGIYRMLYNSQHIGV